MIDQAQYDEYTYRLALECIHRVHLRAEKYMHSLLEEHIQENGALLKNKSPTFANVLNICEALKVMEPKLCVTFRKLNKLRNKYVHIHNYVPDPVEVSSFIASLRQLDSSHFFVTDDLMVPGYSAAYLGISLCLLDWYFNEMGLARFS